MSAGKLLPAPARCLGVCLLWLALALACSEPPAQPPAATAQPTATSLPTLTAAPSPMPGALFVDAAQDLGPVSPLVYGSNYGPWIFVTLEVRPQAAAGGIRYLRFPGGNWGDQNDLDEWQIDQYMALCRELGSEPAISVRLRDGTPERAAALVQLVNGDKQYDVRYWSIGNEPNLFPDYDTVRYNRDWRQFAQAMRAVDPEIILVGPDTNQFTANRAGNPKDKAGRDWMEEFLKANGDLVDIVAIHRYPFPSGGITLPKVNDLRANGQEWDAIIPALRALVRQHTGRDLPVAVTEVNSSWAANSGSQASMDSHYNAIWWADALGRMIRQGTSIVAQFALVGEFGLMGKYEVYPIYSVYRMYQQFGERLVYASSDSPDLSIFAARRPDGRLSVMVINLSSQAASYPLVLQGFALSAPAEVWRFDASHNAEQVDPRLLQSRSQIDLPPESISVFLLK